MLWSAYLSSSNTLPWCDRCVLVSGELQICWFTFTSPLLSLATAIATICRACPSTMQSRLRHGSGGLRASQHTSLPPMQAQQAGQTPAQAR